ncbi:hypothetical protein NA56DRAFT_613654, partial [Hyaloscypha hepaticicola]
RKCQEQSSCPVSQNQLPRIQYLLRFSSLVSQTALFCAFYLSSTTKSFSQPQNPFHASHGGTTPILCYRARKYIKRSTQCLFSA